MAVEEKVEAELKVAKGKLGLGARIKSCIVGGMEDWFRGYGELVASRPFLFILLCFAFTGLCGLGLLRFRAENEGIKLWIPENSDFRLNNDWLFANYPRSTRFASLILVAENVLLPEVVQAMYRVSRSIAAIRNINNDTWETMCLRRPVIRPPGVTDLLFGRKKREVAASSFEDWEDEDWGEEDDWGEDVSGDLVSSLYPEPYCTYATSLATACMELGLLELWAVDGEYGEQTDMEIENLSQEDILDRINNRNRSGVFLTETDFTRYLSGIQRDQNGRIVSATATTMRWISKMNMTSSKLTPAPGRGQPIDPHTLEWEGNMLEVLLNSSLYPEGLRFAPNAARSFGDIAGSTILDDIGLFGGGYVMMFLYASLMLGKLNCLQHRSLLAVAGIVGVVMGIVVSYGLCSAFGLFYGPMHSVMPFLMLGIGIDDMFIIVQCFETLTKEQKLLGLEQRFGLAMQQAGTAITVTSVTDVIAFGVGGFTILPALRSFCIYASVGIVATFIFQSTFFLAMFALDQRRQEANRNACCVCIVHDDHEPNRLSQTDVQTALFSWFGKLLTNVYVKATVLLVTATVLGFGLWGNVLLKQEFDPSWFLPPGTYLADWFTFSKELFPSEGERGTVYFSGTPLPGQLDKVQELIERLEARTDILQQVDSWTTAYTTYMLEQGLMPKNSSVQQLDTSLFKASLTQFLFSQAGAAYQGKFTFSSPLVCGKEAPEVLLMELSFTHLLFDGPKESIPAMNAVKDAIKDSNITGRVFAMAYGYSAWETDEVISFELYRNILLALGCVFLVTLLFICDIIGAILIITCVLLTLVDVGGYMHFWGLTIDTVSCNNLIIAIGLCVDYSAHVAHRFLTESGSRDQRVVATVTNIGPAVFNGGFSTFLAFILLASSKSHVFISFFKIFFLVVSFGLLHGLFFLPVILSLVGPVNRLRDVGEPSEMAAML